MSTTTPRICAKEPFPHLPRAPIVEAVIDLRAHAMEPIDEQTSRTTLEAQLQGYRFLDSQREFQSEVKVQGDKPPIHRIQDLGLKGLRFQSEDQKHIAQFNRSGFVFSRLEPYVDWEQLLGEAFRLWPIFKTYAKPAEIQRIGLRFINRIRLPSGEINFKDYIHPAPEPPRDLALPFHHFMHHDTLAVPGHPYAVSVIRTVQSPSTTPDGQPAVILDIDAFTTKPIAIEDATLRKRLDEMRWLKNKAFFGSVTEKALKYFH